MKFASYSDGSATWAEDLVNTYNLVRKREKLPDTATLAELLIEHGIRLSSVPTDKDLAAARALRPVLREVFDNADEEHAVALLNRILADHHAVPHYTHHDGSPWHLHVADEHASPVDQYAVNAAMGLLGVIATSGMGRLHHCNGRRCSEVFVDTSRNQSRRFCSPQICGNREHAMAHRARQR
ncbi:MULTISPECIES: CGNR zinc finger domain-containing protein [unclassified Streptomyces]|uniref:CGNR zinc finger domain-containing protein n=1 Tax=unclassified Streptomyces TaxID=2593676 RepID=UPI003821B862